MAKIFGPQRFFVQNRGGGQNVIIIVSKGSVEVKKLYRSNFAFFLIYSVPFENVNNFCAVSECSSILSTYSVVGCMNQNADYIGQGFTLGFGKRGGDEQSKRKGGGIWGA